MLVTFTIQFCGVWYLWYMCGVIVCSLYVCGVVCMYGEGCVYTKHALYHWATFFQLILVWGFWHFSDIKKQTNPSECLYITNIIAFCFDNDIWKFD